MSIYLDVDGVICDSNDVWIRLINEIRYEETNYPSNIKVSDLTSWEYIRDTYGEHYMEPWKTPGFYIENVLPYRGALEFIKDYCFLYDEDVNFITSSYSGMEIEKDIWLHKHFGEYIGKIVHCWDKHEMLESHDILVEDNKNNIWKHVVHNKGIGIQLNFEKRHPYAEFDPEITGHPCVHYATSYKRVLNILESL